MDIMLSWYLLHRSSHLCSKEVVVYERLIAENLALRVRAGVLRREREPLVSYCRHVYVLGLIR